MIGFVFLFRLLFGWGILHRVLLVVGWCQGLYPNGFLYGSSHYLIPPRVQVGEGNGNPLQCSCLENPRDGGAWWAAIYGVAQSGHDWSDLAVRAGFKRALESITMNKASGGDGIPVELFQILKDDVVKVLHSICQQIWKTQQWPQDWKRSVFIPIIKKGNAKEY